MEKRLIDFTVLVIKLCENLRPGMLTAHLTEQILRSGTSVSLNYAESQSAESRKDFIHKTSLVMKELRETDFNLKIIAKAGICKNEDLLKVALHESNELVSIFYKSLETARRNQKKSL